MGCSALSSKHLCGQAIAALAAAIVVMILFLGVIPAHASGKGNVGLPPQGILGIFGNGNECTVPPFSSGSPQSLELSWEDHGGPTIVSGNVLQRQASPITIIPDRPRLRVITYTVKPGDNVFALADKFGISVYTILWANEKLQGNPDLLRVGETLTILPVSGVYHTVKKGETVESIAKKYKVSPEAIVSFELNHLDKDHPTLKVGQKVIVPGGKKPPRPQIVHIPYVKIPKGARRGTGRFIWPTNGVITQRFWSGHKAIDIGAPVGTPVVASDSGYVVFASNGWNWGYGKLIIVDHGNGYRTYYAHLSSILVRKGESVGKGQRIGSVGTTGHSTGPHLHFEIRYHNIHKNPLLLLGR